MVRSLGKPSIFGPFFRSRWKPKPKSNRFFGSVRFFPVKMETETEIDSFLVFGSVFSGRDGNRNLFHFRFGFFGFPVLVSPFFRFRFVLVFSHLAFYNSIQIPSKSLDHGICHSMKYLMEFVGILPSLPLVFFIYRSFILNLFMVRFVLGSRFLVVFFSY